MAHLKKTAYDFYTSLLNNFTHVTDKTQNGIHKANYLRKYTLSPPT